MGETGREDAGKPCWISSFSGEAEETAELKQETGGISRGRGEEVKELIEEEKTETRLTLRPCRTHKARTRQETPKTIIS